VRSTPPPPTGLWLRLFGAALAAGSWLSLPTVALPAADDDSLLVREDLSVPGATIEVVITSGELSVSRQRVLKWVETSARTVAAYYGRFPMSAARVTVLAGGRGRIGYGSMRWDGGARIRINVGRAAQEADFENDWVLTHEMIHLGFPDLPRAQAWMEEGLATYAEPVARARGGLVSEEQVWREMMQGLPNGLPGPGDHGLDGTRSWGRTYWGGALFWLLADVEIREQTGGRRSLDDALKGILAAGGDASATWKVDRVIEIGDRATRVPVLRQLYKRMAFSGDAEDLARFWKRLGVVRGGGEIAFDETAPLAQIRHSITAARPAEALGEALGTDVTHPHPR
jgi:hypothetical protein